MTVCERTLKEINCENTGGRFSFLIQLLKVHQQRKTDMSLLPTIQLTRLLIILESRIARNIPHIQCSTLERALKRRSMDHVHQLVERTKQSVCLDAIKWEKDTNSYSINHVHHDEKQGKPSLVAGRVIREKTDGEDMYGAGIGWRHWRRMEAHLTAVATWSGIGADRMQY